MTVSSTQRIIGGICLILTLMTWFVFSPALQCDFINFDDPGYVVENPMISGGLTWQGLRWSLTNSHGGNWHPLTSLSHMLDCQLYGLNPTGHHLTNLLLHTATALVLFLLIFRMTGVIWRSAIIAALFAVHPLRIESVVWIAERKDVLSGLFFLLTLLAYVRYVRLPFSVRRYLLIMLLFTLGLLSKPMLVTLPFVLLLLDYWPLGRTVAKRRLIVEKIPLLLLSLGACATTFWAQQHSMLTISVPFANRVANAVVSYAVYLKQLVYPFNLALVYPHSGKLPEISQLVISAGVLISVSVLACFSCRKRPWFLVGWLWYLGMLVPVIGLVQVGVQAHADRYTYLPQIGLLLMLVWMIAEMPAFLKIRRGIRISFITAILISSMLIARAQTAYWRNSITIWTHTLECTQDNLYALTNLGVALFNENEVDTAIICFLNALEIDPTDEDVIRNLKIVLLHKKALDE
ncbi:MAG: tetratricopeptide repeat protein [Kiritimatiellaeota bacterium]|nr:tetratricopeptide repeat protein [Kiritimatiellota bacterium]